MAVVGRMSRPRATAVHCAAMSTIPHLQLPADDASCSNCAACCCQLEVMLITETGGYKLVP